MKKYLLWTLTIAVALGMVACGGPKGKALVSVGSEKITEGDMDMLSGINPRIKAQLASEFGRKKILDNLVEQELLYQASLKEGFDKKTDVKDKINIYRKVIISQAYMDKKMEEAAKKYYDDHKDEFDKLQLSHIMINFKGGKEDAKKKDKEKATRSEKEALDLANKIKQRIIGGESFANVANEVSEDTMTNKRGGDLGLAAKNEQRLVRRNFGPLVEKAFTMKVGEVEGPIKTENAYHIITVTKGAELQPFESAMQGILFKVRETAKNDIFADLKKRFKVEYMAEKKPAAEKPGVAGTAPEVKTEGQPAVAGQPEAGSAPAPEPLNMPEPPKPIKPQEAKSTPESTTKN